MRIALYCHKFWPAVGGLCTYTGRLTEYLVEGGHDVRVFTTSTPNAPGYEEISPRLRVHRFDQKLGSHPPYHFTPGLLRMGGDRMIRDVEIVHSVGYYFFGTVFGYV